jgi:hypothetical protein
VTGLLTCERDVSGLAAALRALVDDGGWRVAMGVAARRKMEREHNIVDRMALIERMYDEAIDEHRARRGTVHRA